MNGRQRRRAKERREARNERKAKNQEQREVESKRRRLLKSAQSTTSTETQLTNNRGGFLRGLGRLFSSNHQEETTNERSTLLTDLETERDRLHRELIEASEDHYMKLRVDYDEVCSRIEQLTGART